MISLPLDLRAKKDGRHERPRSEHAKKASCAARLHNPSEREVARTKLLELLAKHKKTWNDVAEILAAAEIPQQKDDEPSGDFIGSDRPASLDLIRHILQRHLHLTEYQFTALTLWIAHTFKYHRFSVTPRLALLSPVRGCGKTTVLNLIQALAFKVKKFDHTTPAVLFRLIDREHPSILLTKLTTRICRSRRRCGR